MQPVSIIDLTHRVIARLIRRGALVNSHAEFRRVDNAQSWPRERETSASTDAFHRPVVPSFLSPRQHVENVDKDEAVKTLDLRASDFDAVAGDDSALAELQALQLASRRLKARLLAESSFGPLDRYEPQALDCAITELNDVDRALERAGHLLRVER